VKRRVCGCGGLLDNHLHEAGTTKSSTRMTVLCATEMSGVDWNWNLSLIFGNDTERTGRQSLHWNLLERLGASELKRWRSGCVGF
jgi:hypothetical protein